MLSTDKIYQRLANEFTICLMHVCMCRSHPDGAGPETAMEVMKLDQNLLTGTHLSDHFCETGKRVYHSPMVMCGHHPDGAGSDDSNVVHGFYNNQFAGIRTFLAIWPFFQIVKRVFHSPIVSCRHHPDGACRMDPDRMMDGSFWRMRACVRACRHACNCEQAMQARTHAARNGKHEITAQTYLPTRYHE